MLFLCYTRGMSIIFIAPDNRIEKTVRQLSSSTEEKIVVEQGLLETAIPVARQHLDEAEVFVSRGGTVLVLREMGSGVPIVEMQVTARDLAIALEKARHLIQKDTFRIGVVSFPNMIQQLKDFLPFLSLDITCYELSIGENVEDKLRAAMADGMDVLLGGVTTYSLARKRGLPVVLIESGETSVKYALEEANRIVAAQRLNRRRAEEFRIITESISEAVIAVDERGKISRMNGAAKSLLRAHIQGREGGDLALPETLKEILTQRRETRKILQFGDTRVLVNVLPVAVKGATASSVATLQDVSHIQAMEEEIRREMYLKGYTAKFNFADIVARDELTLRTVSLAKRFAATNASILIQGESGVGKEVFAQSIHNASDRRLRPFIAMNCAAIPESLIESELFGYVDGAFTGARKKGKPGIFELAHGGTIFLDEISEMPFHLQARLLRVLQEHEVMRLGDDKIIPIDVRIIAATNRNLEKLTKDGLFRVDLYWRLNVLNLFIPPLHERREDVLPLIDHMLSESEGCSAKFSVSSSCRSFLESYNWPGNVRELKNFCERVSAICDQDELDTGLATTLLHAGSSENVDISTSKDKRELSLQGASPAEDVVPIGILDDPEGLRDFVSAQGSLQEAAKKLGIHRTTLWRRLKAPSSPRSR